MVGTKKLVYTAGRKQESSNCKTITKIENGKKILSEKTLCFNCTGVKHRAVEYPSKRTCQICKGKHYLSLCKQSSKMMVSTEGFVEYPVVVVKVNNIICRTLLYVMPCAIWYHLYNLKNMKNTHGGVLILYFECSSL